MEKQLKNCPSCGVVSGKRHENNCTVERCSVCGTQRYSCECNGHDRSFARWTGIWPGEAEAHYLGLDGLNELYTTELYKVFFVKPKK